MRSTIIAPSDLLPVRRALLSVSDKSGLVAFAKGLARHGVALVSTGGSAETLRKAGLVVEDVSAVTGFPEMMDGRVKTLHPKIHGGLLYVRGDGAHEQALADHAIAPIDLLVVNLYPFEETVAKGAGFAETIENIDIGGPALIRAAAKNHDGVAVIVDPADYESVLAALDANKGSTPLALRRELAARAFARTASYDAAIANWFEHELGKGEPAPRPAPRRRAFAGTLSAEMRYGENPHQRASLYLGGDRRIGVATARQLQGKELSYNNINDTDAAFELVAEFGITRPAVAIIKHANPCGVAIGATLKDAYVKAFECDTVSAFGGIIALNHTLDGATAEEIAKIFTEVIIAPDADEDARRILSARKNLRLLVTGGLPDPAASGLVVRQVAGGYLVQDRDNVRVTRENLKIVTKRAPDARELDDMLFAFTVAKHVKSNAIVYARDLATAGIGAGQMNRRESSRIGAWKARDAAETAGWKEPHTKGSAVASDAFFPFPDGLLQAAEAGATCVIQPGGSMRDADVIKAADEAGLAMAFTGIRHFRH